MPTIEAGLRQCQQLGTQPEALTWLIGTQPAQPLFSIFSIQTGFERKYLIKHKGISSNILTSPIKCPVPLAKAKSSENKRCQGIMNVRHQQAKLLSPQVQVLLTSLDVGDHQGKAVSARERERQMSARYRENGSCKSHSALTRSVVGRPQPQAACSFGHRRLVLSSFLWACNDPLEDLLVRMMISQ